MLSGDYAYLGDGGFDKILNLYKSGVEGRDRIITAGGDTFHYRECVGTEEGNEYVSVYLLVFERERDGKLFGIYVRDYYSRAEAYSAFSTTEAYLCELETVEAYHFKCGSALHPKRKSKE